MAESISKIYVCNVPIEKDLAHTLYFGSASDQINYFIGKSIRHIDNASYVRKDKNIRFPAALDTLLAGGANYVVYQNPAYNNRWFYAFITSMDYYSPEMTDIKIETDPLQTWREEIEILPSFVEREHVTDDTPGLNTVPEGLETGEYISNKKTTSEYSGFNDISVVIAATETPGGAKLGGQMVHRSYSGLGFYAFPLQQQIVESMPDYISALNSTIGQYSENGKAEAIIAIFLAPSRLCPVDEDHRVIAPEWEVDRYYINANMGSDDKNIEFSTGTIDGYTPTNKKLLTYPYRYLLCDNNAGTSVIYKYEDFYVTKSENNQTVKEIKEPVFVIEGVLTPGCSIRMTPWIYKGENRNVVEGINMGKFPICSWASDVFTNWLTQNGTNIGLQIGTGALQVIGGIIATVATAGAGAAVGGGMIASGVSSIAGTLANVHQQSFTPDQASGNVNSGDVVTAASENDFHFYDMTIKKEYAEIIDGFFNMYGYKVAKLKTPNKAHRQAYWYTKLIDPNIVGKIPQDDLIKIKEAYTRGITFWRSTATVRDYSQTNDITS